MLESVSSGVKSCVCLIGMCIIDFFIFFRFFEKKLRFCSERVWFFSNNAVWFGYCSYLLLVIAN